MSVRKRPSPLKDDAEEKSRMAEAINQRLQQYLQAKHFHFESLGQNAVVMRKRVVVEEHPQLNISRVLPVQGHTRSSVSHHEHSYRDNISILPRQIRNEIESLKCTIQSQEVRGSNVHGLDHKLHESVQSYVQHSKVRAKVMHNIGVLDKQPGDKETHLPPIVEVKSLSPGDGSMLLGVKVPESIRSEIIKGRSVLQRRFNKKQVEDQVRSKIHSSNNLKLKYEEEMKELLEYREKNKRSFNDRFYELQELIDEQIRKQTADRQSKDQVPERIEEENTVDFLEHLTNEQIVVVPPREQCDSPVPQAIEPAESTVVNEDGSVKRVRNTVKPAKREQLAVMYRPPKELNVIYENKMKSYREFLFQMNLAHGCYDPVRLSEDCNMFKNDWKYRAYVGRGNNSLLIKGLLKRRFWWIIDEEASHCQFVWTQLKMNSYFDLQVSSPGTAVMDTAEELSEEKEALPKGKKLKKKLTLGVPQAAQPPSKYKPTLPVGIEKILTKKDQAMYRRYEEAASSLSEEKLTDFDNRVKLLEKKLQPVGDKQVHRLHNHLQFNYYMGNKKAMFYNMRQYYQLTKRNVFDHLPLTFHIKKGLQDRQYKHFLREFKHRAEQIRKLQQEQAADASQDQTDETAHTAARNIWIVKPGELSNRGSGITVVDELYELNNILKKKETHANGTAKTYIVQAYLDRPLLYHGRKFDLRHYMLVTTLYGKMRAYWYSEGYVRTSSALFDLDDLGNDLVHLTNDAIQKHGEEYGRYQEGNKLSYVELQRYFDSKYPKQGIFFYEHIYPQMRQVALDAVRASYMRLDPRRLHHNFEVLGLDFMIDRDFKVWLIEINTNPCLEISSVLLGRIIPTMVEHSFRLTLDVLFPPPAEYPNTLKHLAPDKALDNLKFELIFDEESEAADLRQLYRNCKALECGDISEEDETFDNDGKEVELDVN